MARDLMGPASAATGREPQVVGGKLDYSFFARRSPRRQRLALRLHAAGPKAVFEAMLELEAGAPLDAVLEDYGCLDPEVLIALGGDALAIDEFGVIDGSGS
jgi:hypothetical protein